MNTSITSAESVRPLLGHKQCPARSVIPALNMEEAMSVRRDTSDEMDQPLTPVSSDRLVCLLRHWTWADAARVAFDRELAGARDDGNLVADRPFGAYYHWCALLCALSEAALGHALLSSTELTD